MGSAPEASTFVPKTMKALQYSAPEKFAVVEIGVPSIGDDDVLVKISACGVCSTDLHYHKGEFLAKYPLIPGHEGTGTVVQTGKNVTRFSIGDHVVADPLQPCLNCFYCMRGQTLHCEGLIGYGANLPGAFAQYAAYPSRQIYPIPSTLSPLEAVLIEPAACATHGIERVAPKPGSKVLLFGCGPTGILLAQFLRLNGVAHLTVASKPGPKLDLAKRLNIADTFITISADTQEAQVQMEELQKENPYGFDIVVEATGAPTVLEQSLPFVRKGGTLLVYGVYAPNVRTSWSPSRIWENEITILASFCSMNHMPRVIEYIKGGKLKVDGIASRAYNIEEWEECLEAVRTEGVVKGVVVFE